MPDTSLPVQYVEGDDKRTVVIYCKENLAGQDHKCDGCGRTIPAGERYTRLQYVIEQPEEDLMADHQQARSVDYGRRVITKQCSDCRVEEVQAP